MKYRKNITHKELLIMAKYKDIICKTARNDKTFVRILKELRLYKRYFYLLTKHGNTNTITPHCLVKMYQYIFNGFDWTTDKKKPEIWAMLYRLIKEQENEINSKKQLSVNKLKQTELWKNITISNNLNTTL